MSTSPLILKLPLPHLAEADATVWLLIRTGVVMWATAAGDLADDIHYSDDLRELDAETNLVRVLVGFQRVANDILNIFDEGDDGPALADAFERLHVYAEGRALVCSRRRAHQVRAPTDDAGDRGTITGRFDRFASPLS